MNQANSPAIRPGSSLLLLSSLILASLPVHADDSVDLPRVEVTSNQYKESNGYIDLEKEPQVGKMSVSAENTPFSIATISDDFMEDLGANSIQDALGYTSGIYVGGSFDTRIDSAKVRGLDPSSYVDGLRYNYGYYNTVRIHPYALENIEVLKGPSATLYGQGDLGGIVNMNSKMPKAEQQGEVWAQYGSHNRKQLGVDVTGPVDEDGQLLYRFVGITRDSDTQVEHVNDDSFLIMPSLTWRISDDTNLSVLFTRQKTDSVVSTQFLPSVGTLYDGPLGHIDTDTFVGEPGWDRYDTEMTSFTTMFDHRFNDSWKFSAVARYLESQSWTREHWVDIPSIPAADGTVNRTIYTVDKEVRALNFDARLEGIFDVGMTNHTFVVGVDRQEATYEEDNYFYGYDNDLKLGLGGTINVYNPQYGNLQSGVISYSNRDDNRIEQTGVYVADSMEIGPVVISAALRHDWAKNISLAETGPDTESNEKVNTGRVGLMYRFDNGISPYASYTEAFVMNLGTDGAGGTLEPTTGVQREYGVKYLSDDRSLAITAAYFDIIQQNRVEQGSTPGGVSQTGATVDGWEVQANKRWDNFETQLAYTQLHADDANGKRLGSVAERNASWWNKFYIGTNWRLGAGVRYLGSRTGSGGAPYIPSEILVDAMLGYSYQNWDFTVNAQNVTDKVYTAWCRGAGQDCGYAQRRNITGNVRYHF